MIWDKSLGEHLCLQEEQEASERLEKQERAILRKLREERVSKKILDPVASTL